MMVTVWGAQAITCPACIQEMIGFNLNRTLTILCEAHNIKLQHPVVLRRSDLHSTFCHLCATSANILSSFSLQQQNINQHCTQKVKKWNAVRSM
jgi:hypothetical protein